MAKYHIKMEGSNLEMKEISPMKEQALNRKAKAVSIRLSKNILAKMKQQSGLQGTVSDEKILHAFIVTKLSEV